MEFSVYMGEKRLDESSEFLSSQEFQRLWSEKEAEALRIYYKGRFKISIKKAEIE